MILIDTHTHLYLEEFQSDIQETIQRSKENDVKYMIIPNIDSSSIFSMMNLCDTYKNCCFPCMGVHPSSIKEDFNKEINMAKEWLHKEKFVAIGEIGIDLYWDKTYIQKQIEAFKKQLDLALEFNLPVIIHSRNSLHEIIPILNEKKHKPIKAVFHCYPGSLEQAIDLTQKGYKLGIGGVITYKNAGVANVVKELTLQNIVLETDSPYLSPVPFRGKRNESAYIKNIAQFIAEIKNVSLEEVADITTQSAIELFKLEI